MCARFALTQTPREIAELFRIVDFEVPFPPRYNIAPTQPIIVVRAVPREPGSNLPGREAMLVRWGLLPSWLKDMKGFPLLINARAETAAQKNAFRNALKRRRVLVPASGFYEWRKGADGQSYPFWIRPRDGSSLEPGGSEIDTAAILTTTPSAPVSAIHDRMPVVIRPQDHERWLDCADYDVTDISPLLQPVEDGFFEAVPVSQKVNKVAAADPELQEPLAEPLQDEEPQPAQLKLF
jgi:putative SOS response-associated peptidase YedK